MPVNILYFCVFSVSVFRAGHSELPIPGLCGTLHPGDTDLILRRYYIIQYSNSVFMVMMIMTFSSTLVIQIASMRLTQIKNTDLTYSFSHTYIQSYGSHFYTTINSYTVNIHTGRWPRFQIPLSPKWHLNL